MCRFSLAICEPQHAHDPAQCDHHGGGIGRSMGPHGMSQTTGGWRATQLPVDRLESARRLGEQITLEQVDTRVDTRRSLTLGLDTLGNDAAAELAYEIRDGRDDPALRGVAIELAHERHVELDDLGLERG